uniref:Inositol polyphosphate-related phosphatase domain-containing protein n=1 Tax=Ditylenchus dipsaci TaxID=166011 RepID=A0A915DE97_9BILA
MSSQQLMTRCNCNQHYSLLQFDELQNELNSKSAFSGFQEANENFKPTYKYYIGSFEWDTSTGVLLTSILVGGDQENSFTRGLSRLSNKRAVALNSRLEASSPEIGAGGEYGATSSAENLKACYLC